MLAVTEPACAAGTVAAAVAVSELMSEACFDSFAFFKGGWPCDAGVSGVSAEDPVPYYRYASVRLVAIVFDDIAAIHLKRHISASRYERNNAVKR